MKKEMKIALGSAITLVLFLGAFKAISIIQAISEHSNFKPPPEAVTTMVAKLEPWRTSLELVGELSATEGVVLSAEESAKVVKINFENGQEVNSGDVLVELDSSVEEAQLKRASARQALAKLTLERQRALLARNNTSKAEFDAAQSELDQASAETKEYEARIARRKVVAPFAGITGIREVNVGQFVATGTPIVPVFSIDKLFLTFSVPQRDGARLATGQDVRFTVDAFAGRDFTAQVAAINPQVERGSRSIKLQARYENSDRKLRPGMFAKVSLVVGSERQLITIPGSAILFAPYGDSVFTVKDLTPTPDGMHTGTLVQNFVSVDERRGDQVGISQGITAGQEVVTSGVFKLTQGMTVLVNNSVAPGNDPSPVVNDN